MHNTRAHIVRNLILAVMIAALMPVVQAFINTPNGRSFEKLPVPLHIDATGVKTVVIDAGHGGKDPGCHGSYANEKDICLSLALQLGKLINEYYPEVKVVYTRKTDQFIELHNRAKIANENKADLFICIHVNASGSAEAYGAETYVLGMHKTESNLAVAKRENESILLEDDYKTQYEGLDLSSPEGSALLSIYQKIYLNQSISFASKLQYYFKEYAGRHDRGVRQAGFLVLVRATMPAVLIETGFLTNAREEKYLTDTYGQAMMASSMFKAFSDYKKEVEGKDYAGMAKDFKEPAKEKDSKQEDKSTQNAKDNTAPEKENTTNTSSGKGIVFRVQFLTSASKLDPADSQFKKLKSVIREEVNGMYRYMAGEESSWDKIVDYQSTVRTTGYKDAFVVAYKDGKRIKVDEALQILNKKD